jgi:hypothetical protein
MRSTLSLAVLLAAVTVVRAEDPPKADAGIKVAPSKVVAVTVYQANALVTREVTVPEGAGTVEVVVSPMPPQTVAASLFAEGTDGIRVLSTRFRTRAIFEDTREEVRKLESQIKGYKEKAQSLAAEIKVLDSNMALLTKLEGFTAATMTTATEKGQLNSESVIALATHITKTRADESKKLVALQQQVEANKEQLDFANRLLQEKSGGPSRTERDGVIVLDKQNPAAGKVRFNYLVGATSWHPQYKLKAGKDKEPITIEYLAAVEQQTGEDWTNVQLTLSTAQPQLNASPPELKILDVAVIAGPMPGRPGGLPDPGVIKQLEDQSKSLRAQSNAAYNMKKAAEGGKQVNDAAALEQFCDLLATKDDPKLAQMARDLLDEMPSVTYKLKIKYSLPTRSDEQIIEIAKMDLMPEFYYKAVPLLTPNVYRLANLTNKSDMVLLPGEATMYLGTDFVGQTRLPLVAAGRGFTVGFGIDPQLQVQRALVDKTRSVQGGNQVLKFDYQILVNSYKSEPVKLQVWDRLPHAEASAVAVTLTTQKPDLSKDALYTRDERPKNLLRWDVTVEPNQNGEKALPIEYAFKLELDKQMTIASFAAK